jgi:hypothetical protein
MKPLLPLVLVIIGILSCASPAPNDSKDSSPNPGIRIDQPPTIQSLTAERDTVGVSDEVRFTCLAEDPDGDSLDYAWSAFKTKEDGSVDVTYTYYFGFDTTQFTRTGNEAVWLAPQWPGTYKVFCKVTDSAGYEEMAAAPIVVSIADCIYFVTDKYLYRINEPITVTAGNDQYPLIWVQGYFFSFLTERFEREGWIYIGGGPPNIEYDPLPLEYQESFTWTDSMGLSEPGLYRFKYEIRVGEQNAIEYLISNAFVVE